MRRSKKYVLFLQGRYSANHMEAYKSFCRDAVRVAVDGGYRFFEKANIVPDLLIGDFDSLRPFPSDLPKQVKVIRHQKDKDQTDTHLALEYCIMLGAREIDIVQPGVGESDQFLGNLMLLSLPGRYKSLRVKPKLRIISHAGEIHLLVNEKRTFKEAEGDRVSVVPLSKRVVYSCRGCRYPADKTKLQPGDTLALRNRIEDKKAVFEVTGEAFLIRRYHSSRVAATGSAG
jgi:thiamine pyrophosphokinase